MEAKQAPLIERLKKVPADARLIYEHDQFHSQSIPVGALCAEAASLIEQLRNALAESVVVQPEASTTLEQAESHTHICAKLAEERDALLVAVALTACDAIDDLIEKWHATRESGCLPNQVVRAKRASKLLRAIALGEGAEP